MRKSFLYTALIIFTAIIQSAEAVERIEEPLTFRHSIRFENNETMLFDRLDMEKINAQDRAGAKVGTPRRVAVARKDKSGRDWNRQGSWSTIDDTSVWRLEIDAAGARWLSFTMDTMFLPPGTRLFVYNQSHEQVFGPYTDKDNKPGKQLWTPMVDGSVAYIEINVPTAMKPFLSFNIASVNHGYRDIKSGNMAKSGSCNIDVVCPQGDGWRDEIRSVARYIYQTNGDFFTCTGSLVNNTGGDRKAYFLTANHCVSTEQEAQSMVFYWNFETSVCGGPPDGSQAQTQSGATLRATVGSLDGPDPIRDMTLVELNTRPANAFNVHWSGWDTTSAPPDSGVGIHHPDGSEKRISIDSGPIVLTDYLSGQENPNGAHFKIEPWDEGVTENGSSGSGFWNSEQRIVGVLSGGAASCESPDAADYYAHLASHYNVGLTAQTQIKAWLDPSNTGATTVGGLNSCDTPTVSFSINPNPAEANQVVTFTSTVTGGTGNFTTYEWDFDEDGIIDSNAANPAYTYSDSYIGNVTLNVTKQICTAATSAAIMVFPEGGNTAPVASAVASPATADEGSAVQLNASGSSDADGDNLTYLWEQTAGPAGTLSDPVAEMPFVTLPFVSINTVVTFQVTVTDAFGATDSATVDVTVLNVNRAPVAIVSRSTISINEGNLVTLNAAASSDADGDNLTYAWAQTSGTAVVLSNSATAMTTFSAPQVSASATLLFNVTVSDPFGATDSAIVNVTVNNVIPPDTGGGGGGALGWPSMLVTLLVACLRRARKGFAAVVLVLGVASITACGTPDSRAVDSQNVVSSPEELAPRGMEIAVQEIVLTRIDSRKSVANITDSGHVGETVSALQNRERRYEKIKPLFEYEIRLTVDGNDQSWQVSPSGYIQKSGSNELYKMDMSALNEYIK